MNLVLELGARVLATGLLEKSLSIVKSRVYHQLISLFIQPCFFPPLELLIASFYLSGYQHIIIDFFLCFEISAIVY